MAPCRVPRWLNKLVVFMTRGPQRQVRRLPRATRELWRKFNTQSPRQNGPYFAGGIFQRIFCEENICIWIRINLKFVPRDPINCKSILVQAIAWRLFGPKPLHETILTKIYDAITAPLDHKGFILGRLRYLARFHRPFLEHAQWCLLCETFYEISDGKIQRSTSSIVVSDVPTKVHLRMTKHT